MDREWTYRPPLLIGERIVWLGGCAGLGQTEPCDYGPHHGVVSWIGRLPNMGRSWTVGVDFESDMTGGCDGEWKGRHIFTCQPGQGLFLLASSLIKEDEFYGKRPTVTSTVAQHHIRSTSSVLPSYSALPSMDKLPSTLDISLAPEPPPQKVRPSPSAPSYDIHARNYLKHSGPEIDPNVYSALDGIGVSDKWQLRYIPQTKDKGSSSFSTSIVASSVSSSPAATTSTAMYSSSVCSSTTYTSKEMITGKFNPKGAQDTSQSSNNVRQDATSKKNSVEPSGVEKSVSSSVYEDWSETGGYFGETMIRKSSLISNSSVKELSHRLGHGRQSSLSTPSSPNLGDYQRNYVTKPGVDLARRSTSLSGAYSTTEKPHLHREKSGGFLNIFRWFRNRDRKKRSTSIDRISTNSGGSVNSLTSATSSFAYIPIMRSKSADNDKKMTSKRGVFGVATYVEGIRLNPKDEELSKRLSTISASSDTSTKGGSRSTTVSRKKRPAPQPPGSPRTSESGSIKSHKSCISLPSRDVKPTDAVDESRHEVKIQGLDGRKLQKSKSEGLIYSKKRRAPLPPVHLVVEQVRAETSEEATLNGQKELPRKRQAPAIPAKRNNRPISNISNVSSLSQSPSSTSTTLKSQSSSIASSGAASSPYSTESFKLESGYLKQDMKSSSSPSIPEATKLSLSPRPWYKRKKKQINENAKELKESANKEKVHESWMPDIQFSRSKLSLSGSFRMGKASDEDVLKRSKEEEKKEKRKSQVSLLANISELDRAASEQMQREQEQRRHQRELYDSKFYKSNEPHILTQTDFLPENSGVSDMSTLSSTATTSTLNSAESRVDTEVDDSLVTSVDYDTVHFSEKSLPLKKSYTEQTTLKLEENRHNESQGFASSTSSSTPSPPVRPSRESPLQRASFDAELFYKLAKDTQTTASSKPKSSPLLSGSREQNKPPNDLPEDQPHESLLSQFRRQSKNFGHRMNNFFSPDVSTIIEASESMTSSATTPADDIYDDLPVASTIGDHTRRDSVHDELRSEVNYELRINTSEAREIMQELADVRHEIARINQQEEDAAKISEKKKADKIRDEVLLLRERDNFELWQNVVQNTNNQSSEMSPLPVDIETGERKLKWVCEVCTLINLPWRLQCEACMMRRSSNPKRVDDEGKSVTQDQTSSQMSASDESPVTVIHEEQNVDDNKEDGNAVCQSENKSQNIEPHPTGDKRRKDINWERELQKYFMTFDEHVKGAGDIEAPSRPCRKDESHYGKISRSKSSDTPGVSSNSGKGAKPKSRKLQDHNMDDSKDFEQEPDLEEIRRARTARFMDGILEPAGQYPEPPLINETNGNEKKSTKKKKLGSKAKKSKSLDKEYYKETSDQKGDCWNKEQVNGDVANGHENYSSSIDAPDDQEDRTFYAKNYRKPQVMKPSGVVNSVVSIFNQMEQLQCVKEKTKVTRRCSFSNVVGRTKTFEQMSSQNNSPELPRSQKSFRGSPSFPRRNSLLKDKDIVAAIARFDDMAAMAEVEKIEKQRVKNEMSRKRMPKFTNLFSKKGENKEIGGNKTNALSIDKSVNGSPSGQSSDSTFNVHSSESSSDVLNGERRIRTVSISSGTFELIQAKDFESIEAQHSDCSPLESKGAELPLASAVQPSETIPQIVVDPVPDQVSHSAVSNVIARSASHTESERNDESQVEKQEVERLSQQLTVADGIADFKATLKVEEPNLGQMNTLNINRLLRRLEAAISCGKHAEAAKLAHELAELRVSCSVVRNPKKTSSVDKVQSSRSAASHILAHDNHLAASGMELDRAHTPNSNMSECFYDAFEKLENEEIAEQCNTEINNSQYGITYQNLPRKDSASRASGSKVTNPLVLAHSSSKKEKSSTSPLEGYRHESIEQSHSRDTSLSANIRETRVDPARREVKSDTISKLPDTTKESKRDTSISDMPFNVKMYVEDKKSHQGPIAISVMASMSVGELREKVYQDFGFPPEFQRWILGRRLADDDSQNLGHHQVSTDGCPIFLYLVAPEPDSYHMKRSAKEPTYGQQAVRQSSSQSSLASSGRDSASVGSTVGSVEPKFYNPETRRYEVSVDVDYSDMNEEKDNDEYEDEDYDDDDDNSTDYEDTLKGTNEDMYSSRRDGQIQKSGSSVHYHSHQNSTASDMNDSIDQSENHVELARASQINDDDYREEDYVYTNEPSSISPSVNYTDGNIDDKGNQYYAAAKQINETPEVPSYTNVVEQPLQEYESGDSKDSEQENENEDELEAKYVPNKLVQKQKMTPELKKQKQLIQELQHQQHYMQVTQLKSTIPEPHSVQIVSNQIPKIPKVTTDESHNSQQRAVLVQQPENDEEVYQAQSSKVYAEPKKQEVLITESQHTQLEHTLPVPTPNRTSSLKLKDKVVQANQAKKSQDQGKMKCQENEQATAGQPSSSSPKTTENQEFKTHLPQHIQHHTQNSLQPGNLSQGNEPSHKLEQQQTKVSLGEQEHKPLQLPPVQNTSPQPYSPEGQSSKKIDEVAVQSPKVHGWVCPSCTFVNKWKRPGCEVCATERPGSQHLGDSTENADKVKDIGAAMSALERQGYVPNQEPFECRVCFLDMDVGEGVVLRDCLHTFCRECLSNSIKYSDTAEVKCPYRDNQYSCDFSLQDREIKALLTPQEYEKHLNKSVKQAEGSMQNVFHCKTPDCPGFCQFEDNVNLFHCEVCKLTNCLTCQAQHEGKTCQEYQDDLTKKVDEAAMKTKKFFDDMIRRGDGLPCPKCSVMLVRKWGCDWMRCPMCRTEICWVTRGPRWGPGGPGDVTGGCKCGVRGQKCHPKCTYCH